MILSDRLDHYLCCPVMLAALQSIRPLLFWSWLPVGHPPIKPLAPVRALGLDLGSLEEASDLLLWIDFLHSLYSSGASIGSTVSQWRSAWIARQRVVNRFSSL